MKNSANPPDLFDNLDLFASPAECDVNASRLKNERRRLRQEKNADNLAKALAAFEKEDWMAGLRFAEKTNMKDPQLQYHMGRFYEDGFWLERNPYLAATWYEDAAKQGHEEAKRRLARMRKEGYSCFFSEEAELPVLKRCRKAAERGDSMAQVNWGLWQFNSGNVAEAIKWYQKSAMRGNAKGQCCMGTVYEEGYGVGKDIQEALRWYRLAAENGDYLAMGKLESQYKTDYKLRVVPKEELKRDYIKNKDGLFVLRYKTGNWLPVYEYWMDRKLFDAVKCIHTLRTKGLARQWRTASLGDRIFGKEGPEHEGYGTGELQKWADRMAAEGRDPHEVNLLEWFKGASEALDYHMGGTFDRKMKEAEKDSSHAMWYIVEKLGDFMPDINRMSRARIIETVKQKYYTVMYAPYGNPALKNIELRNCFWGVGQSLSRG